MWANYPSSLPFLERVWKQFRHGWWWLSQCIRQGQQPPVTRTLGGVKLLRAAAGSGQVRTFQRPNPPAAELHPVAVALAAPSEHNTIPPVEVCVRQGEGGGAEPSSRGWAGEVSAEPGGFRLGGRATPSVSSKRLTRIPRPPSVRKG